MTRFFHFIFLSMMVCVAALFLSTSVDAAGSKSAKEPRTGITFDTKVQNLSLEKLGVRTKGPIKVYAVGQYGKTSPAKPNNAFVLKMHMSISREKMSSALMDALQPRCKQFGCEVNQDKEFQQMVLQALSTGGAKSGTTLIFNTSGNKVTLTVNGKAAGKVTGNAIAKAFAAIYTDNKAVCAMNPLVEVEEDRESYFKDKNVAGIITAIIAVMIALWTTNPFQTKSTDIVIAELNVYPIKSCAEQSVDRAVVTPRGFKGDRIAMVVDSDMVCCTSRDADKVKLFHVQPIIHFPKCTTMEVSYKGEKSSLKIELPKENQREPVACIHNEAPGPLMLGELGNSTASWMAKKTGISGCRLMAIDDKKYDRKCLINPGQGDPIPTFDGTAPVSLADEAPLLLTNQASLDDLNERLLKRGQMPVDMRRFRPNIVVDAGDAWIEDTWKKIRIGKVEFFVWQRCGRCIMTTIDRDSLTRATKGEPLSTLNTFREGARGQRNFGMHLIPDPATLSDDDEDYLSVHLGDTLEVLEYDNFRLQEWKSKFADSR
jgi:uncharacterized protein